MAVAQHGPNKISSGFQGSVKSLKLCTRMQIVLLGEVQPQKDNMNPTQWGPEHLIRHCFAC